MIPRRRLSFFVAVTALVLAACGSEAPVDTSAERPAAPSASRGASDSPSSDRTGPTSELLSFKAPAIGGGQVDAAAFQGRPTLLWFWAPW